MPLKLGARPKPRTPKPRTPRLRKAWPRTPRPSREAEAEAEPAEGGTLEAAADDSGNQVGSQRSGAPHDDAALYLC